MFSCSRATELMSASLDGHLSLHQRFAVKIHLFMCKLCSRCWRQMIFLRNVMHECSERSENMHSTAGHSLSAEACKRIKNALREQEGNG